jgi:nucleotide-binding universal stress UspA family protein
MIKTILLALDLESPVQKLVKYTAQLAKPFNAKIYLMHVERVEPDFVGYGAGPQYIRDKRAKELRQEHRYLQNLSKELSQQDIKNDTLLVPGITIETLLNECKKLKADIIVAGTHHHSFLYNAFIGSTSAELFRRAKIPFLGFPLPDED